MTEIGSNDVYDELGVPAVINAVGTKTRIGGTLIREEAVEAMREAANSFARISDLQAAASERIAAATGAEAGYITSGASAALTMAAAAAIAGDDLGVAARLPDTEGVPSEIVMPRTHRNGYDHALRAAGASIVDVGTNDYHLGTASENVEPWEIADAIGEETAAVGYMEKPYTTPPLETVVEIAHEHDVPVIVDAAAELPPKANLERFVETGADLVAFSGGKAIRGPQSTGILAGREDLVQSVAMQHLDMHAASAAYDPPESMIDRERLAGVPRSGIGRSLKVGKEEIAGCLVALEKFLEEDEEEKLAEWHERATKIAGELESIEGVAVELQGGAKTSSVSTVGVSVDEATAGVDATTVVSRLRHETPRVFVGADELDRGKFAINPMCLTDDETAYVVERITAQFE